MKGTRRSRRRTAILVAAVWLPYSVAICCAPAQADSPSVKPGCHGSASAPQPAQTPCGHPIAASGEQESQDSQPLQQKCCELSCQASVTLEKGVTLEAAPPLVATDVPFPLATAPMRAMLVPNGTGAGADAHAPPLYLKNASLRI